MSDYVAAAVAAKIPGMTAEQVEAIISAYHSVAEGAPLGTVLFNPTTEAVAHRVDYRGVHCWRVSGLDGSLWTDLQASPVGWETIREP